MNNYTPFLKLKTNEVTALSEVDKSLQSELTPFFDFPRDNEDMSEEKFIIKAGKAKKSVAKHLKNIPSFYLDNFDIDSSLTIDGDSNYKYLLELFSNLPIIPVVGIDRNDAHINSVIDAKETGVLNSNQIAVRFTPEDFEDFELVADDIEDMLDEVIGMFEKVDIIFDCRVCIEEDTNAISSNIIVFVTNFIEEYKINKIIVTGSSIPSSIGDVADKKDETEIQRKESNIHSKVAEHFEIFFGDYTIVSPYYADINIPGSIMPNIMIPKTIYSYDTKHFIIRGGSIKKHPRSYNQFNDQAQIIIRKPFYRGISYSFGDKFIEEKSRNIGKNVMPGTILKPTINAHITYMLKNYIY
ncbi:MAG: hypothetical protein PHU40_12165 [Sulfurimonas sp.]|nr:hypothetical protein [Sulfurimonas sp.]